MRLLLDEDQVGVVPPAGDAEMFVNASGELRSVQNLQQSGGTPSIGFPNVRSCQGVVVKMADDTLIGGHVASAANENQLLEKMREHIHVHGGPAGIQKVFVARNSENFALALGATAEDKARALGADKVKKIDLKNLGTGTYVQFTAVAGGCITEGKTNTKMTYPNADIPEGGAQPTVIDSRGRTRAFVQKDATLAPSATTMHSLKGRTSRV